MMFSIPLLAQAVAADAISGGAGWVGAGLLGGVLSWLLFIHLPAKDKQIAGLIESKDEQISTLLESKDKQIAGLVESRDAFVRELNHAFRDTMQTTSMAAAVQDKERRDDYKASLATIVAHCEKETGQISQAIRKDLGDLVSLVVALRQLMEELQKALHQTRVEQNAKDSA